MLSNFKFGLHGPATVKFKAHRNPFHVPDGMVTVPPGMGYNSCITHRFFDLITVEEYDKRKLAKTRDANRGRPRLGKTHTRSAAGKMGQNARLNNRGKHDKKVKGGTFTDLEQVIKPVQIPLGRYKFHQQWRKKKGLEPFEPHNLSMAIPGTRRPVPALVKSALLKIYDLDNTFVRVKVAKPLIRTPRKRTRSAAIERLQKKLDEIGPFGDTSKFNRVNAALEEELILQRHRDAVEAEPNAWPNTLDMAHVEHYEGPSYGPFMGKTHAPSPMAKIRRAEKRRLARKKNRDGSM